MGKNVRTGSIRDITHNPKTITAYGHRYRIVMVTNTETKAQAGKGMYVGKTADGVIVRHLTNGKWGVAVRDSKQMRRFLTGR